MSIRVIRADHVSKRYRLGSTRGYKTVRETLSAAPGRALRRQTRSRDEAPREVLALNGVSFEIDSGELVGIIGLNGAGKTTILKILSRITKPTAGWAEIRGRVGSLLEVGTGFHPELTGRENVFLNGAILGMSRQDISRRFDEIVSFADVEGFLDTPVKRYSSGMKVRLAFAVAAHLEPEILIIDEVLAVGDLAFQKKCLGKMGDVTDEGRTVLFVSHNMSVIRSLCRRGILLANGSIVTDGPVDDTVGVYLKSLEQLASESLDERTDRRGWQQIQLTRVELSGHEGPGTRLVTGEAARFLFEVSGWFSRMLCAFTICNHLGQAVTTFSSTPPTVDDDEDPKLRNAFECTVDELLLVPGRYRVDVTIEGKGHRQDQIEGAAFFDVEEGPVRGRPLPQAGHGDIIFPHRWRRSVDRDAR
jgi:lipopolysaccharide transport system ATP-binding protein